MNIINPFEKLGKLGEKGFVDYLYDEISDESLKLMIRKYGFKSYKSRNKTISSVISSVESVSNIGWCFNDSIPKRNIKQYIREEK